MQNPLSRIRATEDDEDDDEGGYIPSSPLGRIHIGRGVLKGEEGVDDMDLASSPPRLVATIDSFENRNRDYLRF